jgi:GntR family transcriptional regulator, arabinose operon transcriptional repressor
MPYRSQPLYMQIKNYILDKIEKGELSSNDPIASEKELSNLFNVSRITVTNALNQLKNEGIVFRVPGKGTFVGSAISNGNNGTQNNIARSKTNLIGVILCHLESPFHINLISSLEQLITKAGYIALFGKSNSNIETEISLIDNMLKNEIAGLIIYPTDGIYYNERLIQMTLSHFPLILLDRTFPGINTFSVTSDNYQAAHDGAEFLLSRGHKKFVIFDHIPDTSTIHDRIRGFNAALAENNINSDSVSNISLETCWFPDPENIHISEIKKVQTFLKNNRDITAAFAINSGVSLIIYKAATNLNINVPRDLEILTFDNPNSFHTIHQLPIHYIDQKEKEILCPKAVDLLIEQINNHDINSYIGKCELVDYKNIHES